MDPKFLFWCGALLNMAAMFGFVANGVRQIRRGRVEAHRRSMVTATALVALFLGAYVVKSGFLGREDFSLWSVAAIWNLRIHESCVLVMLLAGGVALQRAWRMRGTRRVTRDPADAPTPEAALRWHRRAGWTVVVSAALGLLTACFVLAGMYLRLPPVP